jgi:hypothetical protein
VKVKELRDRLRGSGEAPDLQAFDELLKPLDEVGGDELCAAIKANVAKLSKAATAKKKKLETLNSDGIDRYVAELM